MKRILSVTGILISVFLLASSFSIRETPQDPPRGKKKTERHINLVKVDENGKKTELDTIVEGNQAFIWHGDTIGGGKELKWIGKEDFVLDSLHKHMTFDVDVNDNGENVFILKSHDGNEPMIYEFKSDGDSAHAYNFEILKDIRYGESDKMVWRDKNGERMIVAPKIHMAPTPPIPPVARFFGKRLDENIINLNDKSIVSYKKKKMKGGREKITIIRNQPGNDVEIEEEVIVPGGGSHGVFFSDSPKIEKSVKVFHGDGGKVEVLGDGKVWHIDENAEDVKVIHEGDKVIRIKEIKGKEDKKVEVEVEVEKEKHENSQENN